MDRGFLSSFYEVPSQIHRSPPCCPPPSRAVKGTHLALLRSQQDSNVNLDIGVSDRVRIGSIGTYVPGDISSVDKGISHFGWGLVGR